MADSPSERRAALADAVTEVLAREDHVTAVIPYGSLPEGRADPYSDIDLRVELSGVSDRSFAERLPDILSSIGPRLIESWGPTALPDRFIRTLYFSEFPLFWHVDVWCRSDVHGESSDLMAAYHWPQMFRVWIDELKKVLRGATTTVVMDGFAREWMEPADLASDLSERLSAYLHLIHRHTESKGVSCDDIFSRCDALLREYLERGTVVL